MRGNIHRDAIALPKLRVLPLLEKEVEAASVMFELHATPTEAIGVVLPA
jgi:hypothetical protein